MDSLFLSCVHRICIPVETLLFPPFSIVFTRLVGKPYFNRAFDIPFSSGFRNSSFSKGASCLAVSVIRKEDCHCVPFADLTCRLANSRAYFARVIACDCFYFNVLYDIFIITGFNRQITAAIRIVPPTENSLIPLIHIALSDKYCALVSDFMPAGVLITRLLFGITASSSAHITHPIFLEKTCYRQQSASGIVPAMRRGICHRR